MLSIAKQSAYGVLARNYRLYRNINDGRALNFIVYRFQNIEYTAPKMVEVVTQGSVRDSAQFINLLVKDIENYETIKVHSDILNAIASYYTYKANLLSAEEEDDILTAAYLAAPHHNSYETIKSKIKENAKSKMIAKKSMYFQCQLATIGANNDMIQRLSKLSELKQLEIYRFALKTNNSNQLLNDYFKEFYTKTKNQDILAFYASLLYLLPPSYYISIEGKLTQLFKEMKEIHSKTLYKLFSKYYKIVQNKKMFVNDINNNCIKSNKVFSGIGPLFLDIYKNVWNVNQPSISYNLASSICSMNTSQLVSCCKVINKLPPSEFAKQFIRESNVNMQYLMPSPISKCNFYMNPKAELIPLMINLFLHSSQVSPPSQVLDILCQEKPEHMYLWNSFEVSKLLCHYIAKSPNNSSLKMLRKLIGGVTVSSPVLIQLLYSKVELESEEDIKMLEEIISINPKASYDSYMRIIKCINKASIDSTVKARIINKINTIISQKENIN